ncbi:unnamed protein product [Hymenolepis diminuta]|uniref:Uncharacterized protein n=1 Tax=Hymenolepis diminuta TaxID=6216 RepID=A0A564Y1S1_HYMDI|nr:unnamed protein product [Hymenolepis diminuta]
MQRNDDVDKFFILYGDEEQKMFFEDESVTDIGLAYLFGDVWRIGADENRTEAVTSKLCEDNFKRNDCFSLQTTSAQSGIINQRHLSSILPLRPTSQQTLSSLIRGMLRIAGFPF